MKRINLYTLIFIWSIFLLSALSVGAQSPNWGWFAEMGAGKDDYGQGVTVDNAGNVYTTGSFEGTVDFKPGPGKYKLTSAGYSDIFISKLDNNGNFIWAKQMSGANSSEGLDIVTDEYGNVYITGGFYGMVDFDPGIGIYNLTSVGDKDIFVCNLDSSGNFIWAKRMGGGAYDIGGSIVVDATGYVYTSGYYELTADFNPGIGVYNLTSIGNYSAFISKLDSLGNFVWAKSIGGSGECMGIVFIDSSDNIYVSGAFKGIIDINPGPSIHNLISYTAAYGDIFIAKFDSAGDFQWGKGMGGTLHDAGSAVAVDKFNNVFIAGYFSTVVDFDPGPGFFELTSFSGYDIFILKLDSNGNFIWVKSLGAPGFSVASSLKLDDFGNIYTTGRYSGTMDFDPDSIGVFNLTAINNKDGFICKLDSAGNFLWALDAGDEYESESLSLDSACNTFITGTHYFGTNRNIFIEKISNCPSISSLYVSSCYSYTSPSGNHTWTISGTYKDTIPLAGCDSIIIIHLIINNAASSTISINACNTYTSPSGNYSWTTSGTYYDTIPNVNGCDSLMTINLNISSVSTSSSQTIAACDNYISPSGNYNWTNSGIYLDTIPNAGGCDSMMTIYLTIVNSTSSSITDSACGSYISPSGNYIWTTSGIYHDTISNIVGCDSTITVYLTVAGISSTIGVNACFSYTSPSGLYIYTASGTYKDTLTNIFGCDSIITIILNIKTVDITVTQNGVILTANATGATYHWLDCNNSYATISGATQKSFTANVNGSYAVAITLNGCTDTSACYTVTGVGINEINSSNSVQLFPNPVTNHLTIVLPVNFKKCDVTITDITGKIIYNLTDATTQKLEVNTKDFSNGIYFVQIQTPDFVETRKLIIAR